MLIKNTPGKQFKKLTFTILQCSNSISKTAIQTPALICRVINEKTKPHKNLEAKVYLKYLTAELDVKFLIWPGVTIGFWEKIRTYDILLSKITLDYIGWHFWSHFPNSNSYDLYIILFCIYFYTFQDRYTFPICIYISAFVYVFIFVFICMYICLIIYIHVCIYVYVYIYVNKYMYIFVYIFKIMCTNVYVCICK